jgi:hypothetical protein
MVVFGFKWLMNLVVCFASAGRVSPDFHFRPKPPFVPDRQIFDSPPVNRQPEAPPAWQFSILNF